MNKSQWRTLSIKVNANRKAVAVQLRVPLTPDEWAAFMAKLDELRPELVEEPDD